MENVEVDYQEPRALRDAKIKALQSLSLDEDDSITWTDLKLGYKIIYIWF